MTTKIYTFYFSNGLNFTETKKEKKIHDFYFFMFYLNKIHIRIPINMKNTVASKYPRSSPSLLSFSPCPFPFTSLPVPFHALPSPLFPIPSFPLPYLRFEERRNVTAILSLPPLSTLSLNLLQD